jgi:fido (protein-threonine AMPylation protein)
MSRIRRVGGSSAWWVSVRVGASLIAQRAFLRQLALDAGHTLAWEHLDSKLLVHASQRSLQGDNLPMRDLIEKVLDLPGR